jgi:hypothetical protein
MIPRHLRPALLVAWLGGSGGGGGGGGSEVCPEAQKWEFKFRAAFEGD